MPPRPQPPYASGSYDHFGQTRYLVVDNDGKSFRHNGFRRVQRISSRRGNWLVKHIPTIDSMKDVHSVWYWVKAPWRQLNNV